MATDHLDRLSRLRVLGLDRRQVAQDLAIRAAYYEQRQNDALGTDWEGYKRTPGETYMRAKQRTLGYVPANPESIPWGSRRPTCPTSYVGFAVDTYTALLLGESREPSVRVPGDDVTSELVQELLEHSSAWDTLGEARTIAGSRGAAAIVAEVEEGKPSHRAMAPENLYVEWKSRHAWEPSLVIEQKRVKVEFMDDSGALQTSQVWRTRAWDESYAYIYQDVLDSGPQPADGANEEDVGTDKQDIELAQAPIAHGAGRCPVVWMQNTRVSDNPYGEPDCEPVFEQIDQLDRLHSMLMRGSKANNDPTLVVADKQYAHGRNASKNLGKGYGQSIRLSESGKAELLEISGDSINTSWKTFDKVMHQVELRVGVMSPDPERSGAYQSGVALQILHRSQNSRAGARRKPLGIAISQLIRVWIGMVKNLGTKDLRADGRGIELPLREICEDGEKTFVEHSLGDGGTIKLNWPPFHSATPLDIQTTAQGLALAAGGLPTLSQESAVAHMVNLTQTDTDVDTELARIRDGQETKVGAFDDLMRPDVEGLAELEPELDPDMAGEPQAKDVQDLALNGAQTKALFDALVRADRDLDPETVKIGIRNAFPAINNEEAEAMVSAQVEFNRRRKASLPPLPPEEDLP